MMDYEADDTWLAREWFAARVVVLGGFVIAIAVTLYFAIWSQPASTIADTTSAPQSQPATAQSAAANEEAAASTRHQVCRLELANAQNFGLIPSFGRLSDPEPKPTGTQGRYACQAATPAAKYTIMADLVCRNLGDPKCVAIYSIVQDGTTTLYQRQN